MNDINNLNSCTCDDRDCSVMGSRANAVFNVLGVMFFVTFLGYVALHCF